MSTTSAPLTSPASPDWWTRASAAIYDPFLWAGERAGMLARRRALLAHAAGTVVEIGAGTGLNLLHYPTGLGRLVVSEPDPAMRQRLSERAAEVRPDAEVIDAAAERLPFPDGSVDTVVSTLVLCTVDAPDRALAEIARVLRPGGQLLFIEHVRSESPRLAAWQDRLVRPWRAFARGCRCDRATTELMIACGFEFDEVGEATWRGMPPIVRPLVVGRAHPVADHG